MVLYIDLLSLLLAETICNNFILNRKQVPILIFRFNVHWVQQRRMTRTDGFSACSGGSLDETFWTRSDKVICLSFLFLFFIFYIILLLHNRSHTYVVIKSSSWPWIRYLFSRFMHIIIIITEFRTETAHRKIVNFAR